MKSWPRKAWLEGGLEPEVEKWPLSVKAAPAEAEEGIEHECGEDQDEEGEEGVLPRGGLRGRCMSAGKVEGGVLMAGF